MGDQKKGIYFRMVERTKARLKRKKGRNTPSESHRKSLSKAISWRVVGTLDTFVIAWVVTGEATWASAIAGIEVVTKVVLYYLHERAWAKIK